MVALSLFGFLYVESTLCLMLPDATAAHHSAARLANRAAAIDVYCIVPDHSAESECSRLNRVSTHTALPQLHSAR